MTIQISNTQQNHMMYSDHNTVTTVSDSSEVFRSPTKSKTRKSKDKRRRSKRNGSSTSRKNKKESREMLMGLIAQEMNSNWNGEEEAQEASGLLSEDTISPADIFYAQMNGEALNSTGSMHSSSVVSSDDEPDLLLDDGADDDEDEFPDHTSFSNLTILPTTEEEGAAENVPDSLSVSQRSGTSRTSRSDSSSSEATLSINEIQEYVMANMPEEVKDKIPKEAWGRIFGKTSVDQIRKPRMNTVAAGTEEKTNEDQDEASVVSDITEFTGYHKVKRINHTGRVVVPFAPEEEKEQSEELCPMLPDPFSPSERSSGEFSAISVETDTFDESARSRKSNKSSGVRFDRVQVRYYERCLEVNPAVTNGAAIGIGWRYKRGGSMLVDDWELNRGEIRRANDMVLSRHVRENMLKSLGYTQNDIATATRIVLRAKNNRKMTVNNLPNQHMEEAVEKAARKVKGLLTFGRKKGLVSNY